MYYTNDSPHTPELEDGYYTPIPFGWPEVPCTVNIEDLLRICNTVHFLKSTNSDSFHVQYGEGGNFATTEGFNSAQFYHYDCINHIPEENIQPASWLPAMYAFHQDCC